METSPVSTQSTDVADPVPGAAPPVPPPASAVTTAAVQPGPEAPVQARRPRLPPVVRLGIVGLLGALAGLLMSYLMRKVGY